MGMRQKKQQQRLSKDQRRVDRVLESYREMKRHLGRDDSRKVEHYMQAVRDVEQVIERMELWAANAQATSARGMGWRSTPP